MRLVPMRPTAVFATGLSVLAITIFTTAATAQLRTASGTKRTIRKASLVQDKTGDKAAASKSMDSQPAAPAPPAAAQAAPDAPAPDGDVVVEEPIVDEMVVAPGMGANCGACNRWTRVDYLIWWQRGREAPALVSTGPLGNAGTQTLFPDSERFGEDAVAGGRIDFGFWLDRCMCTGVGARFYSLGTSKLRYAVGPADDTIIARPFFNTVSGVQDARLVNSPNVFSGTASVDGAADVLGGDVYYRKVIAREAGFQLDFLAGYQFARIDEDLIVSDSSTNVSGGTVNGIADGTNIRTIDNFRANNEFNGGNFGFESRIDRGCWSARFLGKIGFGEMRQQLTTSGLFVVTDPVGGVASTNSGVLVQPSNTGVFNQSKFAVAPEFGVNAIWHMNDRVDFTVGYSFLFWSSLIQTGNHVDLNVNPTQSSGTPTGAPSPTIALNDSSFWVHGINFGMSIDW